MATIRMGYVGPAHTVAAGQTGEIKTRFYAGPKDQKQLEKISPFLEKTIDYGLGLVDIRASVCAAELDVCTGCQLGLGNHAV